MASLEEQELEEGLSLDRNSLTVLVTGILVIIAGFVVYSYFSRVSTPPGEEITLEEFQEEGIEESEGEEGTETEGIVAGEETVEGEIEGDKTAKEEAIGGPEPGVEVLGNWVANDFEANSVSGDSYTVQYGDTLWEIAEGRYGSGFEWGKILDANKDSIGFLANGSQALITPGQVLNLTE